MGLMDIFKPKWKHSDPEIRILGVNKLSDQAMLAEVAKGDEDYLVRETAVDRIEDQL